MASSPVSASPASPVAPIQAETGQTTIHDEVQSRRSGGTNKRRRRHLRPAVAAAPSVPAADAQVLAAIQAFRTDVLRAISELQASRAETLAALRTDVLRAISELQASRAEMLAAVAAVNDVRRLLRVLLALGGSSK